MTDPSAGRPSTPEEPKSFTEDDVQIMWAARMQHTFETSFACVCGFRPSTNVDWEQHHVRAGLEALAAAGRLLPASSEHHEEWGCLVTEPHARRSEQVGDVIKLTEEQARYGPTIHSGWTTVKRVIGPWMEVNGDG